MKPISRAFPLWLVLGGLSCLLAKIAQAQVTPLLAAAAIFGLPVLAVWLTARAVAELPERRLWRIGFWAVTVAGWSALLVLMQGGVEWNDAERPIILAALGLAGCVTIWHALKARSLPSRRVIGEVATAVALLALGGGVFAWSYDARTRSIVARAEARWSEIGLPMSEFEKTLAPSRENVGSEVVRQVLREQVNSSFYKFGTDAANREPATQSSKATDQMIHEAVELLSAKRPPSDDLDLSSQSVAAFEPAAAALDADYRRILEAEPAIWASDPHDGYYISVPNFLGIRKFVQLTAADSMRRLAIGDQDGAARALAAGLRLRSGLLENPTMSSLMIAIAVDGMLAEKQVRLPAAEDGLPSLARDAASLRVEFLRRLQMEAWVGLRMARQVATPSDVAVVAGAGLLPGWAARVATERWYRREFATSALNGAEHAAIQKSPATMALPDFGARLHAAISEASPSIVETNSGRVILRIHAILLLREQAELIRDARASLAAGHPVESRDSVVLPGRRWRLTADAEKGKVTMRLVGAPEWIVKNEVTGPDFWVMPLDGSVAWQFHLPARTASRD